jgi:hypothetical protein
MEQHDSPRGPCGLRTGRSALLAAGVLVAGVLATAAPTSAAHADGCNTGCGYGGWAGYTHGGYGGYGCNTGCGYGGYGGYYGYNGYLGYAGHHAPEYGAALPVHGFMPFELAEGESSVVLGVTPSTGEEGTEFTWTATVSCGELVDGAVVDEPVVDGTVTFDVNNHSHYTQTVPITAGTATLTLTPPEAGFYTADAYYNGDGATADGMACALGALSNTAPITVTPAAPPPPPPPPGPGNVNNNNNHQHQSQSQSVVVIIGGHAFRVHLHHAKMTAAVAPAAPSAPLPVTG